MLKSVKYLNGVFTAKDEMNRAVTIFESISFIFEVKPDGKRVTYSPIDYHKTDILDLVSAYLRGLPVDKEVLSTLVIRFGWMDKRLNKLSFISLTDLMEAIRGNTATPTQRRKLVDICKQLSLSQHRVLK